MPNPKKLYIRFVIKKNVTMSNNQLRVSAIKVPGFKIELYELPSGEPAARLLKFMTSGRDKGEFKRLEGFRFGNEEKRSGWITRTLLRLESARNAKLELEARNKAARAQMVNPFKVGEILSERWGYEQTNVDFYEIVELKPKSVVLRAISSELVPSEGIGSMSGRVAPVAGSFIGEPFVKPVKFFINQVGELNYFLAGKYRGRLDSYEGKSLYCSWYA